jgi:hypothetical protein
MFNERMTLFIISMVTVPVKAEIPRVLRWFEGDSRS